MFAITNTFSSYSVDDLNAAKSFYEEKLGLDIREEGDMGFSMQLTGGTSVFIYPKEGHKPAEFTVLNFAVENIDSGIDSLEENGIRFLHYDRKDLPQDEKGVLRGLSAGMGPDIAWFKDPAGNILSILQEE